MIKVTLKQWRAAGVAATLGLTACGGEAGAPGGEGGGSGGEGGETGAVAPAAPAGGGGEGGESGEAGAASAYAGVSGEQLTALRLAHLRGFILIAEQVAGRDTATAGVLAQQGLLEVYDAAPTDFGSLNAELVRAAADGSVAHLHAAKTEIDRASATLTVDHAALTARLVDIATGLYQSVNQGDHVDPIEYQHSMGAALAAKDALTAGAASLRADDARAFGEAQSEMDRFVALWSAPTPPPHPAAYRDVLAAGSRVRLALSPYL